MGRTVAVLQSNYIPWKGYFDIIHDVDLFVFYDSVQYTKGDWRNRNRIKTPRGLSWLSVPVGAHQHDRICDVPLPDNDWPSRHWRRLLSAYRQAPHFERYAGFLEDLYRRMPFGTLSELNQHLVRTIAHDFLGLSTRFEDSRAFPTEGTDRLERLVDVVSQTGATKYVCGPAAQSYLDPRRFEERGIEVAWKDYSGYPEYPQLHPPFCHQVSILDLLFNAGEDAPQAIWGWRDRPG